MTSYEHVGTVLRQARTDRHLALRDVEAASKELATRNADLYDWIGRNLINILELEGWPALRTADPRKVRSLLELLFGGVERFTARSGVDLHLSPAQPVKVRIPVYREESKVSLYEIGRNEGGVGTTEPLSPLADFAIIANSDDLRPVVFSGQTVQVRLAPTVEAGQLAVVHYNGQLYMAYCADPATQMFARLNAKKPGFTLKSSDAVLGIVQFVAPRIPNAFLPGQPSRKATATAV